ncbi:MAG: DUF2865 domain-containing protein [Beijerinckiaceae bacterium]|nr:DUF2865 domain-containing protein [Beijerinckiaceae bacterium]
MSLLLGAVIAVSSGIVLVKAGDSPMIRETIAEINKPIRRAVQTYAPAMTEIRIPQIFRRSDTQSVYTAPRPAPMGQAQPLTAGSSLPQGALEGLKPVPSETLRAPRANRSLTSPEPGLATATNYCVRLCDGFAFPVGRAGMGDEAAHEAACRMACPNAQTALFTMPRGAKDFSDAYSPRGGANYSALPTAFRYRDRYDQACACRPKGATQSASALLTDFTLRRGDLAMTRIGMRHFDGSASYPLRANQFSDALRQLKNPREVQLVRGMEAASLRGIMPISVQANVRQRVTTEIVQAETKAGIRKVSEFKGGAQRFEEMRAARPAGPLPVRQIDRRQGLIAMN